MIFSRMGFLTEFFLFLTDCKTLKKGKTTLANLIRSQVKNISPIPGWGSADSYFERITSGLNFIYKVNLPEGEPLGSINGPKCPHACRMYATKPYLLQRVAP